MAWYRVGTVALTINSPTVTGTGTDFVANARAGDAFIGPDGRPIEILSITSATVLTLVSPYQGATAGGQSYSIQPTQAYERDLALGAATLLATFAAVRDGIGAGLISSAGTVQAPNLRFANDQDTGFRRVGENSLSLVTGGVDRIIADTSGATVFGSGVSIVTETASGPANLNFTRVSTGAVVASIQAQAEFDNSYGGLRLLTRGGDGLLERVRVAYNGNVGIGTTTPMARLHVTESLRITSASYDNTLQLGSFANGEGWITSANSAVQFLAPLALRGSIISLRPGGTEVGRIDGSGNLLLGVADGSRHRITKVGAETQIVLEVGTPTAINSLFYAVTGAVGSSARSGFTSRADSTTGRSINAGGTINASGGDACEVFWKSVSCGPNLKGALVGIDADGKLTRTWAEAVSGFGFKTTNPHLVGRDTFHRKAGEEPKPPVFEKPIYDGPAEPTAPGAAPATLVDLGDRPERPVQDEGEEMIDFIVRMARWVNADAAWVAALATRSQEVEAFAIASAAQEKAAAQYAVDLQGWEEAQAEHRAAVEAAEAAHASAVEQFAVDHAAWKDRLTAAAKEVDRIATNGQVPVEFDGEFEVGQILVPIARGAGIGMKAVDVDDATEAEMRRSLGSILKRLAPDDPDTIETEAIWGRPAVGKPWVFVSDLARGRPRDKAA